MVHAAGAEPGLGQNKACAFVAEAARDRDAHVAQQQLAVAVDGLVLHHRTTRWEWAKSMG